MPDTLIAVRNLEVSLPDMAKKPPMGRAPQIHILKGLNFDVPRGSVVGIVGESGSGKSTLGRTILRLIEPTGGTVIFDDEDITHAPEKALKGFRQKAQMIFQDPLSSLNPRHTILGLIAAPLTLRMGRAEARTRAAEALEMVGLPANFARRYPHELSGGQRQRVGIARAIAQRPAFILADEIASGLDVSSQAVILSLLEDLARDLGLTLAFISHDLSVVRRLCDRTIVMADGQIVEDAATPALFTRPSSEYTRALIDAIPLPVMDQLW